MLTGAIKSQVDQIWSAFWSGGISNPIEVIEQITYLLFIRRLDELHTLEENKATRLGEPITRRIFPKGRDKLRWSRFKHLKPTEMYEVVATQVFPFLRELGGDDSTYAQHMKDARFTIPTPALLGKVVDRWATSIWRGATPRAISTSTCSRRSPGQGRTGSSARRATLFGSWWS